MEIWAGTVQGAHQSRSVIVRARLARDEVNRFQRKFEILNLKLETISKFKIRK